MKPEERITEGTGRERKRERERESKGEETRGMSYNLKEIEILKINYNILSKIQYTKASP